MSSIANRQHRSRARTGRTGERIAAFYLLLRGHRIVARNLRVGRGEIDLLVFKNGCFRLVEVRTTRGSQLECPTLAVTWTKQRQLLSLATLLSGRAPYCNHPLCIDIIGIRLRRGGWPKIVWLRNALDENTFLDSRGNQMFWRMK